MKTTVRPLLLALCALAAASVSARADVVIDGSDDFRKAVQACLDKITKTGGDTAAILSGLESSGRTHVITETKTPPNTTTYKTEKDGESKDAGGTGKGTDTTIAWGPTITTAYGDGTPRDPCASLLHELSHARDADQGIDDPRNDAATGIPTDEIKACTAENVYRQANGLPNRTQYGTKKLPPSAIPKVKGDDAVNLPFTGSAGGLS